MVCLRIGDADEPTKTLESLSRNLQVPAHVRWSAVRWHMRMVTVQGGDRRRNQLVAGLEQAATRGSSEARIALVLCKIDVALVENHCGSAALLEQLAALDPGLLSHLLKAAKGTDPVLYVARFYPY